MVRALRWTAVGAFAVAPILAYLGRTTKPGCVYTTVVCDYRIEGGWGPFATLIAVGIGSGLLVWAEALVRRPRPRSVLKGAGWAAVGALLGLFTGALAGLLCGFVIFGLMGYGSDSVDGVGLAVPIAGLWGAGIGLPVGAVTAVWLYGRGVRRQHPAA